MVILPGHCVRQAERLEGQGSHGVARARTLDAADAARALRAGEVEADFQPRVDLLGGRLTGVEALARWRQPGAVGPALFVPALAEAGLSGELTLRIFDVACDALDNWAAAAGLTPRVTINVADAALADPGLVEALAARANARGVEPSRFTLEPDTEMPGAAVAQTLRRLRQQGFRLATSLSQLGRFHFSELRIDHGLVRHCDQSGRLHAVVRSAMDLAQRISAHTVAEGIETAGEWNVLAAAGCDEGQGYYIAPPLSPETLPAWYQTWRVAFATANGPNGALSPAAARAALSKPSGADPGT